VNRKIISIHSILLTAFLATIAHAGTISDQVGKQFREYCLGESTDRGERLLDDVELPKTATDLALKLVAEQKSDGTWPDVDYAGKGRASWGPFAQLTRTLSLTLYARRSPGTDDARKCLAAAHLALAYWDKNDFKCPNWWYNTIGVPKMLGTIGILMDTDLTNDERTYITTVSMPRAKLGSMTGQNKVWLAGNNVMRAVLIHDDALIAKASKIIAEEIQIAPAGVEGIQIDDSFHQHGPQQQFGNYGMAFCVDMTRWAVVLRNTPGAIPREKIAILHNYLINGENWVVWKDAMDILSCGRQFFPNSPVAKAKTIAAVMATMKIVNPQNLADYAAFTNRNKEGAKNDLVGTQYFFRSDYLIHRTADMMASLKMRSERIIGGETVNSENLSGRHLADGATLFYQSGDEYTEIFPVWNWKMIPGTTCEIDNGSLSWPARKKAKASAAKKETAEQDPPSDAAPNAEPVAKTDSFRGTSFVGAVTDGTNAAAAMDFVSLESPTLNAKKSYFFYNNLTICLGANITSTSNNQVFTTLNQALLRGEVHTDAENKAILPGAQTRTDIAWIEHDNFRYIFPKPTAVSFRISPATGNWKKVFDSASTPKKDVSGNLFTLFIDHGVHPQNASYAYFVAPASEKFENRVEILSNTGEIQAVRVDKKWLAAVFYKSGKLEGADYSVEVDSPCIMCMEASGANPRVWIADPTQKLTQIGISAGGSYVEQKLPAGTLAGKTIELGKE